MAEETRDTRADVAPKEAPDPAGTQKSGPEADEKTSEAQEGAGGDGEWVRLPSSWVHSMRFQKDKGIIQIVFKNGYLHESQATNDQAEGLKTAGSPGGYVWKHWPPHKA